MEDGIVVPPESLVRWVEVDVAIKGRLEQLRPSRWTRGQRGHRLRRADLDYG